MMTESPRYVIGLTGLPSSGKGEVTTALLELARERGWTAEHLSFSDRIKEEARVRGISEADLDRALLAKIGIEMREAEGPGVLAARIARKIKNRPEPRPDIFIVEALRHVGEIEVMRREFGERFVLAAVESDTREIARRLIARRRPDESREALASEENAARLLEQELNGQVSELGPNVGECIAAADVCLPNHGTLSDLRETVGQFFAGLTNND